MSWCPDNQEVGLEAATLERVRNSSLVEDRCADNVTGLSTPPKHGMSTQVFVVGERRQAEKHNREAVRSEDECECRNE